MNIWHDISDERISPDEFISVVEISRGSKKKYEIDKETGFIRLDRILFTSMQYPTNYGFIPKTLALDHDPLDVLLLCSESLQPLCLAKSRPIGVLKMIDNYDYDEKIIAVAVDDPIYGVHTKISDLSPHRFEEMKHFFKEYKQLENMRTTVVEIGDAGEAKKIIAKSIDAYKKHFGHSNTK